MSKSAIRWLYRELPELVVKGILPQEAADKLRQYYGEVKTVSKTTATLIIIGSLGALLIGLGIILLLAHNWEQLSRFIRSILSLAPLVIAQGLALWVLKKRPQSGALKEGTAIFLSLMVGASIALISQTYHLPGDTSTFIFTWMMLILPIVYLMEASLPAAFYLMGITEWAGSNSSDPLTAVLFWPLAALILPHFIWSLRREIYAIRSAILSVVMIICVSFAASFSLGKTWHGAWIIIFPSIYAIFYFLGWLKINKITTNWQKPLRLIGAVGLFVLAFTFTFRYLWQSLYEYAPEIERSISDLSAIPDHFVTLIIIAAVVLLFYYNLRRRNWLVAMFGAVPFFAVISYSLTATLAPAWIFNIYLFILSISRIITGAQKNKLTTINTGMLMLAVLIIVRFFDSNIGFIIKGLVFMAIGSGFLITNLLLARRMGGAK